MLKSYGSSSRLVPRKNLPILVIYLSLSLNSFVGTSGVSNTHCSKLIDSKAVQPVFEQI